MNFLLDIMFDLYVSSTFLALASVILYHAKFRRIIEIYELEDIELDVAAYILLLVSAFVPLFNFILGMKYFQIGILFTDAEFVRGLYSCVKGDEDER